MNYAICKEVAMILHPVAIPAQISVSKQAFGRFSPRNPRGPYLLSRLIGDPNFMLVPN